MRTVFLLLAVPACVSTSPGSFVLDYDRSVQQLVIVDEDGGEDRVTMEPTGTRDVGGTELTELTVKTGGADVGLGLVVDAAQGSVTLGGFSTTAALNGIDLDVRLDAPLVLDVTVPVGTPQAVEVDGTITLGGADGTEGYLPLAATYTVQGHDAVAPTPMGDIPGCHEVTFDGAAGPLAMSGTIWTHDDLGFVHADLDAGAFGTFSAGMGGYVGWEEGGATSVVQSEGYVSPSSPAFYASTTRGLGVYDADKNVHAKMFLEMRWADDALARTATPLPVTVLFTAGWGYFPHLLVQSDTPYLHPEEASEGYVWWLAFVDEAAKNDPSENPISFDVSVNHDGTSADAVKIGTFIAYGRYAP